MNIFAHHVYEYKKGLRLLVLHTDHIRNQGAMTAKLDRQNIAYIVQRVTPEKINIFFGDQQCINVLKAFPHLDLRALSPEQDFILGAMLGYDIGVQCTRYVKYSDRLRDQDPRLSLNVV